MSKDQLHPQDLDWVTLVFVRDTRNPEVRIRIWIDLANGQSTPDIFSQ